MTAHLELSSVKTDMAAALFLCISLIWLPRCGKEENQPHLASVGLHREVAPNWEGALDSAWQANENVS